MKIAIFHFELNNLLNWITTGYLNWIIFWIEFSWNDFESNIELNKFWAKFKHWIESIWVSDRAITPSQEDTLCNMHRCFYRAILKYYNLLPATLYWTKYFSGISLNATAKEFVPGGFSLGGVNDCGTLNQTPPLLSQTASAPDLLRWGYLRN